MKQTIYALALVLGSIGGTYALVKADTFDRDYKTYRSNKPEVLFSGYYVVNPQTNVEEHYNEFVTNDMNIEGLTLEAKQHVLNQAKAALRQGETELENFINRLVRELETVYGV